jgi:hypothetical protein
MGKSLLFLFLLIFLFLLPSYYALRQRFQQTNAFPFSVGVFKTSQLHCTYLGRYLLDLHTKLFLNQELGAPRTLCLSIFAYSKLAVRSWCGLFSARESSWFWLPWNTILDILNHGYQSTCYKVEVYIFSLSLKSVNRILEKLS